MSQSKVFEALEKLMLSLSPPCSYDDGLDDPEDDNDHLQDQTLSQGSVFEDCCMLRDEVVRPTSSDSAVRIVQLQNSQAACGRSPSGPRSRSCPLNTVCVNMQCASIAEAAVQTGTKATRLSA